MKLPNIRITVRDENGNSVTLAMRGTKADVRLGGEATMFHVNVCGLAANQIRHQWVELCMKQLQEGGAK